MDQLADSVNLLIENRIVSDGNSRSAIDEF